MSVKEAQVARPGLLRSFEQEQSGTTVSGEARVSCGPWGSCIQTVVPRFGGKQPSKDSAKQFSDGKMTVDSVPTGSGARVSPGTETTLLKAAGDQIVLGNYIPTGWKEASSAVEAGKLVVKAECPNFRDIVYQLTVTYADASRKRIDHLTVTHNRPSGPPDRIGEYEVTYLPHGGKRIDVSRYSGNRLSVTESYTLTKTIPRPENDYHLILDRGEKVVDLRLGKLPDQQVSYVWNGKLPTVDQLKQLHDGRRGLLARVTSRPWLLPAAGLALILIGIALLVIQKRKARPNT